MNPDSEVRDLIRCVSRVLHDCWRETGFGSVTIESERINGEKIRAIVKGSTHYRFVVHEREVNAMP